MALERRLVALAWATLPAAVAADVARGAPVPDEHEGVFRGALALLCACAGSKPAPYHREEFDPSETYTRVFQSTGRKRS